MNDNRYVTKGVLVRAEYGKNKQTFVFVFGMIRKVAEPKGNGRIKSPMFFVKDSQMYLTRECPSEKLRGPARIYVEGHCSYCQLCQKEFRSALNNCPHCRKAAAEADAQHTHICFEDDEEE